MGGASASTWWTQIAESESRLVRVARIGRPHGLRGEVTVTPFTDDPDRRFAAGVALFTDRPADSTLTVVSSRRSGPVLVVGFEGVPDRDSAETLRGTELSLPAEDLGEAGDEDDFYDHQLVGLAVVHVDGRLLGEVVEVMHPPAAPVLVVRTTDGGEELVPFVKAIVPEVDPLGGRLVVDPPEGMF